MKTTWEFAAPLQDVYELISDTSSWSRWWPDLEQSYLVSADRNDGIDSVWHYVWSTYYFCKLEFDMRVVEIHDLKKIVAFATGDLEGTGSWEFSTIGPNTVVIYEWDVMTNRWWMRLLAPLIHRVFEENHEAIMQRGGRGLARWLGVQLVRTKTVNTKG